MITWYETVRNVTEQVTRERETWETMDVEDYAHEFADSHEVVIYYSNARELWDSSYEVREYEDTALECMELSNKVSIDQLLCAVVYWAIRDLVLTVISENALENVEG